MRTIARTAVICLLGATITIASAQSGRPLYDDVFFSPCEDVVTDHIAWAKPFARGPVKVLFITHRNAMREVVELAQRLEMDYTVFACESPSKFGETGKGVDSSWKLIAGNSAEELTADLNEKLADRYDVIVIGGLNWDILPLDSRYYILKQVKEGAGLVGSIPGGRDVYISKILVGSAFTWSWNVWSGAAKEIPDYFGIGVFEGTVDRTVAHTGETSVSIRGVEVGRGSKEDPRAGYNVSGIELEPNTEYIFSVWATTRDVGQRAGSVSLYPEGGGLAIAPSDDWTRFERRFTTNANPQKLGIYLLNYGLGTVWYDDVSLVKAGDEKNLVPNPSFEKPGPAPEELVAGVPTGSLPAFASLPDPDEVLRRNVEFAPFGSGRVGLVTYAVPSHQMMTPGPRGSVIGQRLDYDYYLALAIKLILWGAGKQPPVGVTWAAAPVSVIDRDEPAGVPLTYQLTAAEAMTGVDAALTVRDRRNRVYHRASERLDVAPGGRQIAFATPALPRGEYFADLILTRDGKSVGFGSIGLEVTSAARISELALAADSFPTIEPVAGRIAIEGDAADAVVRLSLRDGFDRLAAQRDFPVRDGRVSFRLPAPPSLTLVRWLTAELLRGDEVIDTRTVEAPVSDRYPDRDDIQFVMWMGYPNDFIGPMMAEEFSRNGIDAMYNGTITLAPYFNQWWIPYSTRFVDTKTDWYQEKRTRETGDLVRSPCLTDPEYRAAEAAKLTKVAETGRRYGTSDFTLGDENHFVAGNWDLCFSDTCVADFRTWAQQEYGTLQALNASWGSQFTDWEQVRPQTLEECKQTGNYVPWVDHRLHMDTVWADMHAFSRDVIQKVVPGARVGYEGSDTQVGSFHAADYWKLSHAMDLNNIYYRDFASLAWADFASDDMLYGAGWFGGYPGNRNDAYMRYFPWRTLFKGANSYWVWAGYGSAGSVMAFDTSLYPFFQVACEQIAEIKSGIGKLLITADRQHDGIALLYSPASVHVATYTDKFPDIDTTLNAVVRIVHDLGLECRVLSSAQVEQGELTNDEFRALIMPSCQAVSEAEAEAIRRFADNGGHVIADLRPGVTDEHGKPYEAGILDDLFGVKQAGAFTRVDKPDLLPEFGILGLDGSLQLAGATALGDGPPYLTSHASGKGMARLLNFGLDVYNPGKPTAGTPAGATIRFMGEMLGGAGVGVPVALSPTRPNVEISRFRNGDVEYVGVIQGLPSDPINYTNKVAPPLEAEAATLEFGRRAHIYDVRAGRYLGQTATVQTEVTPSVAQLYALLPYRVESVTMARSPRMQAGAEEPLTLTVKADGEVGTHVVHIDIIGPDGEARGYYSQNLLAEEGSAITSIRFALDDQPGEWTIVATDVASGVTGRTTVVVAR